MCRREETTIERTYELTKYLEHQLKDIKDTYLSYLGPPFSDPDFSPPRPNSSSLSVPSAATRVELWRGLENGARLAQNQRAYRVLLCAMRELAHSTLCPYLQSSLLHFCSGLNGLLGSITGLMGSIGYTPPQLGDVPPPLPDHPAPPLLSERRSALRGSVMTGQHSPAPLRAQQRHYGDYRPRSRDDQRYSTAAMGGAREAPTRRRDRERDRGGERGRRGEESAREGGMERWGRRRRLLSIEEVEMEEDVISQHNSYNNNNNNNNNINNNNNNKYTFSTWADAGKKERTNRKGDGREKDTTSLLSSFSPSPSFQPRRPPRSLSSSLYAPPTLPPSLSLLLQYGTGEGGAHALLAASPLLSSSAHPTSNEFSRKVEGFWVLRELQSWLWRSAKDFNRLKKRLKA
ncbi:uncharacterized protein LOC116217987 [Clupea harengus]|uniref:Uncharacterized protein LOC116217987 n=1 Tax=Clupea harengus TaxID=7950 RepID=A0A8M1K4J6_CLUHA|nr:uncharacterized protein LOC116217987 [Clupea harengus]